jgi:hypothetical protein
MFSNVPALGRFSFAKYLSKLVGHSVEKESIKEPREDVARFNVFYKDRQCQQYVLLAIENYAECLNLDLKHIYEALPKLLSLWFDFVSAQPPANVPPSCNKPKIGERLV